MESWSAPGLQQVGSMLRRPLCSDRLNPASDLLEVSRGLLYKHRPWDIKGLGLAHALGAGRPCVSSGLGPATMHTQTGVGFRHVVGGSGVLRSRPLSSDTFTANPKRGHSKPATATDRH